MNMFNYLKEKADDLIESGKDLGKQVYVKVVGPSKDNLYKTEGKISPAEFIIAGDKLVSICQDWKWKSASEKKFYDEKFPQDKQYLECSDILCEQRIKDQELELQIKNEGFTLKEINLDSEEFGIVDDSQKQQQQQLQQEQQKEQEQEQEKQENQQQQQKQIQQEQCKNKPQVRKYDISICYDSYNSTAAMYLKAVDQDDNPISQTGILEDINPSMIDKTATFKSHPHNGVQYLYVHPCKQAQSIVQRLQMVQDENSEDNENQVHNAFKYLLEFWSSVIPTIQFSNYD